MECDCKGTQREELSGEAKVKKDFVNTCPGAAMNENTRKKRCFHAAALTTGLFHFFTNFFGVATPSQAGDMESNGLSPASTGISRDTANIFHSKKPRLQHKKQCVTQPKEELQGIFSAICLIHPEITIRKFLTLRCESSFVPAHSLSPGGHSTDRSRSSAW